MTRVGALFGAGLRQLARTPALVVLTLFLPASLVVVFTWLAPDQAVEVQTSIGPNLELPMNEVMPILTAPGAAALLTGIVGLFVMRAAESSDGRLTVAGLSPYEVVAARLGLLSLVAVVATVAAVEAFGLVADRPANLGLYYLAVLAASWIYGAVGSIAGLILDRLAGVYVVLVGVAVDLFVFQSPLAQARPLAADYLPGHYPLDLATDAAFSRTVLTTDLVGAGLVAGALTIMVAGAFRESVQG